MTTQSSDASTDEAQSADSLVATLARLQDDRRVPPVQSWHPARVGQIDIRIAADGQWYHEGRPILRQPMVRLFASVLRRDDGVYYLVTPAEKLAITVEDVPFIGLTLARAGSGAQQQLLVTTNVDDHVTLDAQHRLWMQSRAGQQVPYIEVRDGLHARLVRAVFYELAHLADEVAGEALITSCGTTFSLGKV